LRRLHVVPLEVRVKRRGRRPRLLDHILLSEPAVVAHPDALQLLARDLRVDHGTDAWLPAIRRHLNRSISFVSATWNRPGTPSRSGRHSPIPTANPAAWASFTTCSAEITPALICTGRTAAQGSNSPR